MRGHDEDAFDVQPGVDKHLSTVTGAGQRGRPDPRIGAYCAGSHGSGRIYTSVVNTGPAGRTTSSVPPAVVLGAAYLAGSIPFSHLMARRARGVDLRTVGSGTVSGTGVFRSVGFAAGMVAGIADLLKGAVGPLLAGRDRPYLAGRGRWSPSPGTTGRRSSVAREVVASPPRWARWRRQLLPGAACSWPGWLSAGRRVSQRSAASSLTSPSCRSPVASGVPRRPRPQQVSSYRCSSNGSRATLRPRHPAGVRRLAAAPRPRHPRDVRELLRAQGLRSLLIGQSISALGDWMGTIAVLFLVQHVTGSAAALGGVLVVRLLPGLLAGPLAARATARWGRRGTMLSDGCRAGRHGPAAAHRPADLVDLLVVGAHRGRRPDLPAGAGRVVADVGRGGR